MNQKINADIIITRHAETFLNSLIHENHGYSKMEWESCLEYKQLTENGLKQACQLGCFLNSNGWIPDIFITSSSERAIRTAKIAANELHINLNDNNFIALSSLKETCCFEYINNHIPNHTFKNLSSYEGKIAEAKKVAEIFSGKRFINKKVLFVGHELRNTFLLDAILGKRTIMDVSSVSFPNCGIQLLKRGVQGHFIDLGGIFTLDSLL